MSKTKTIISYIYKRYGNTVGFLAVASIMVFGLSVGIITFGINAPFSQACCVVPPPPVPPPPIPPIPVIVVQLPPPTCTLSASPTSLPVGGGSSTLSWKTTAGTSATISSIGTVSPVSGGSKTISVTSTTGYTMTVSGPGGQATCSAKVKVALPPPPPPPTCTLSASPSSIQTGDASKLTYTTSNATSFIVNHSVGTLTPVASGSTHVSPTVTTTYTGTAKGVGGTVTCGAKVKVTLPPPPPPPTSVPTCTLSASPTSLPVGGGSSTLSWKTTNSKTFSLDKGIGNVVPISSGATTTQLTVTTTYTGIATDAVGATAKCSTTVIVNTGGGGGGPSCTLKVSPQSISSGSSATLSWGGGGISSVDIDRGIAMGTTSPGSISVAPLGVQSYTYKGTFHASNGQTLVCSATLQVTGGSGCSSNCGGPPPQLPIVTLSALPHIGPAPLAYLYLSQIPYTGLDLGPFGTALYWILFVSFVFIIAYLVLFGAVPFINRYMRGFGRRAIAVLNFQEYEENENSNDEISNKRAPAPTPFPKKHFIHSTGIAPEAQRDYSSYDGFKSFAHDGVLSIEDIVNGLSRQKGEHTDDAIVPATETQAERDTQEALSSILSAQTMALSKDKSEKIKSSVDVLKAEPVVEKEISEKAPDISSDASARAFLVALLEGDRTAVFYALRQVTRGGDDTARFLSDVTCMLDDVFRARVDGTDCDTNIVRLCAKYQTPVLESLVSALATGIDSSYSSNITATKLAIVRALSVIGA